MPAMSAVQAQKISLKAIGVVWRDGRLLAAEVADNQGQVAGVRPLGGTVEFRELSEAAVKREFWEELGVGIDIVSGPVVFENLYTHAGYDGHEVIFVFEVEFSCENAVAGDPVVFHESDGTSNIARWYDPAELDLDGQLQLYPKGLKGALAKLKTAD